MQNKKRKSAIYMGENLCLFEKSKDIKKLNSFLIKSNIHYPKSGIIYFSYSSTTKNLLYIIKQFKKGLKNFLS